HLGETTDIAEGVAIPHGLVGRQTDFDRDAARIGAGHLRRQQTVIAVSRGAANALYLSLFPVTASDQTHISEVTGLDLLEIPFGQLNGYEPMGAVCEIEQRLALGPRRPRTCRDRPDHMLFR